MPNQPIDMPLIPFLHLGIPAKPYTSGINEVKECVIQPRKTYAKKACNKSCSLQKITARRRLSDFSHTQIVERVLQKRNLL
jgi:hypothetical protein